MERKQGRPSSLHPDTLNVMLTYVRHNPGAAFHEVADAAGVSIATAYKGLQKLRRWNFVTWQPLKKRTLQAVNS